MKTPDAPPWFPFYACDWLASLAVTEMTPAERGGLIQLLCHDWVNGGLPDDDDRLASLSGLGDAWFNESAKVLRPWFASVRIRPGYISNPELQLEREKYVRYVENCQKGGAKSARNRRGDSDFGRRLAERRWMRTDMRTGCELDANQPQPHIEKKKEGGDRSPCPGEIIVPSLQEVITWGQFDGVEEQTCKQFHAYFEGLGWMLGSSTVRNPRAMLKSWAMKRKAVGGVRKESASAGFFRKKTQLQELEKVWQEHPGHPNANFSDPPSSEERAEFRKITEQIKQLRRELTQGVADE